KAEFLRQCDKLDGIADGIVSNYIAARAIFNVNDGVGPADPWAALRASNNVDPDPNDKSESAKLTNEQIKTMEFVYSSYKFATPLANGVKSFGMWLPTTEPAGFGMIEGSRFKGQEGADENARVHGAMGVLGVTGFLMQDLKANPLDYVEGGQWNKRREQLSKWLDSTNPDLTEFYKNGGKLILTIGLMDNIASPGAQLDYYQSLLDKMGRSTLDQFARMYVVPNGGHGLAGKSANVNGEGKPIEVMNIPGPNGNDNMDMLMAWVEKNEAPAKTLVVNPQGKIGTKQEGAGYLMCSYPNYAKYVGGPADQASSYVSEKP
ncbi:MAG TPA: tannase/feruloyl esterase family alpha/beta hydrolase, partial [Bacteroidales bacterium]|nr:tannase/feruloyl esterase family alpha/beta hydrolase [Bacteroidales bacterium]